MNLYLDEPGRLKQGLMQKAGYFIFLFVLVVNVLYHALTEVGVNWEAMLSFSTDALIYLCSVYVTFCAMADTAKSDAKASLEYKEAHRLCKEKIEAAKPHRAFLSAFITKYLTDDLTERKRACLEVAGVSYEDYQKSYRLAGRRTMKAQGLTKGERKAVCRAKRMRQERISREGLLTGDEVHLRRSPLLSPAYTTLRRYTAALLPSTLFAVFSAQIVFAVTANDDPKAVLIETLLRIGLLSFTAYRGYTVGEKSVMQDRVGYLLAKADFLGRFIATRESITPK